MRLTALALTLSLLSTAADADCLKANTEDQVAEGRLTSVVVSVPAYSLKEHAYILRLAAPACLDGDDEYDKVDKSDRIHVYSTDDKLLKRLRQLVGKMVRVRGSPFGEENAHHHAPIVMGISAVEPLLKR
jgi:Domain of unknown function (DUF4431)